MYAVIFISIKPIVKMMVIALGGGILARIGVYLGQCFVFY